MSATTRTGALMGFPRMVDLLTPGKTGSAAIDYVTVSKEAAQLGNMRAAFSPGGSVDMVSPGTYARLVVDGELMMTDTDMERRTNREVLRHAHGDVLIAGLGLGMIVHPMLANPAVRSVTVLESSADVIALIAPSFANQPKLIVVHADTFTWKPTRGQLWDVIYFDIWPTVSEDNLSEMATLARRFARRLNRVNSRAWMGAWRKEELRHRRRSNRRYAW